MRERHHRWSRSVGVATLAAGLLVTGCEARSGGDSGANATVNLSSLPAAEAWVDGKAAGSTPLAVPLSPGRHEVVLKQAGFSEHRQTLDVAAGAVATVDATLLPDDPMDPDAVRQIAAAYGITVEPFRAPEVHRGAAAVGGVALLFPRNDVRKEGLTGYRIDVTPAYEGGGFLEFRKGKTSLHREKFEPDTLVNVASLPAKVVDALKTGDTVTWGVYFSDARKPITAQFEVVAKPTASKKLAELSADKRLAAQPAVLRQQLEAEVLQNYRLYSEALVRLLDMRAADKDNLAPYTGIVSCLRRLDLEDSALFTEAASKAIGVTSRRRGQNAGADAPSKRNPVGTMPAAAAAPAADAPSSAPLAGPAAPSAAPTPTPRHGATAESPKTDAPASKGSNPGRVEGSPKTAGGLPASGPLTPPVEPAPAPESAESTEAPTTPPQPTQPGERAQQPAAPESRPALPGQPTPPAAPETRPDLPGRQPEQTPTPESRPALPGQHAEQTPPSAPTQPPPPSGESTPAPSESPAPAPVPPAPIGPGPVPPAPVPPAPEQPK